jgi:Protein of unknown function (DUF4240)
VTAWRSGMPHFRAMDIDQFWALIERARTAAGPAADQAVRDFDAPDDDPDRDYWDFDDESGAMTSARNLLLAPSRSAGQDAGEVGETGEAPEDEDDLDEDDDFDDDEDEDDVTDPVALALLELLTQLSAADIAAFDNLFEDLRASAETQDMANAAVLIEHGFLGDDSFDDFRAGLVALGRTVFEGAVANPDSLANHQLVREIAASNDPRWLGREDMLFVASHAYAVVTGEDEVTFYDFAEGQRVDPDAKPDDEQDQDDDEPFWTVEDEAETRRRLPRLAELFYQRSTRNRARAMEKLGLQD